MNKLLVVGSIAFDSIETPFGRADKIVGGSATYISLAASYFKLNQAVVSIVGGDFPQSFLRNLEARNVDTTGVQVVQNEKSFYWKGKYKNDLNSRDTLITETNVFEKFSPQIPEYYKDADFLMLGNIHPSLQLQVIEQMRQKPKLIVLDTIKLWITENRNELENVLQKVDVISINNEEARDIAGEYSLVKAAKKIMTMGPKYVIIKKGEHGVLLFHQEAVFFAPALPIAEVFDPTGAGDTFAGGFIGHLASTSNLSFDNMKLALVHGSNLASFCVEKFGTLRMEELTQEHLKQRLRSFKQLTQFEIELNQAQ